MIKYQKTSLILASALFALIASFSSEVQAACCTQYEGAGAQQYGNGKTPCSGNDCATGGVCAGCGAYENSPQCPNNQPPAGYSLDPSCDSN